MLAAGAARLRPLTPIEKVATILTAIGPEHGGVPRELAEPDMERFARAINGLGKISQEVLDAVIVEFLELLTTGPEISGGSKAARTPRGRPRRRGRGAGD